MLISNELSHREGKPNLHLDRALVGWATAIALFGLLIAQTKTSDHTPDLIIWSVVAILDVLALRVGWKKAVAKVSTGALLILAGGELVLSAALLVDILHHLHSL